MLMIDEKVLADFLEADVERNRKLDALIFALKEMKPEWMSLKGAMEYSGLNNKQLTYRAKTGEIRRRNVTDKTYEYNFEDLRAFCGK